MYQNIPMVFIVIDTFMSDIGSRYGITPGSRENSLYNAIWVAQALLRKGYVSLQFMPVVVWFITVLKNLNHALL